MLVNASVLLCTQGILTVKWSDATFQTTAERLVDVVPKIKNEWVSIYDMRNPHP